MTYEMTFGLCVTHPELYARYRAEIRPLLGQAGAEFRYDFEVSRVLAAEAMASQNADPRSINRVFMLAFPSRGAKETFFGDPRYREIRGRLFDTAVHAAIVIAEYERAGKD